MLNHNLPPVRFQQVLFHLEITTLCQFELTLPCSCSVRYFWFQWMFLSLKPEDRKSTIVEDNVRKSLARRNFVSNTQPEPPLVQLETITSSSVLHQAKATLRQGNRVTLPAPLGYCNSKHWLARGKISVSKALQTSHSSHPCRNMRKGKSWE